MSVEWRTRLSPSEITEALYRTADAVGIPAPFAIGYPSLMLHNARPGTKPYLGHIDRDGFVIQARPSGADPFALLCIGVVARTCEGSIVRFQFRFHRAVTWFFRIAALWAVVVGFAYVSQES